MLGQGWAGVVDGGPALAQHRANASCLLGYHFSNDARRGPSLCRRRATAAQRWASVLYKLCFVSTLVMFLCSLEYNYFIFLLITDIPSTMVY